MANISRNPEVRRSRPTFQLTNCTDVVVRQFVMRSNKGRPVEEEILPSLVIEGNVQPLKYQEIMQMPEADRTREWIKIYTNSPITTAEEPLEAEKTVFRVEWEGQIYKVMREKHYVMGVLDHYCIYCAREPISAI